VGRLPVDLPADGRDRGPGAPGDGRGDDRPALPLTVPAAPELPPVHSRRERSRPARLGGPDSPSRGPDQAHGRSIVLGPCGLATDGGGAWASSTARRRWSLVRGKGSDGASRSRWPPPAPR